MELINKRNNETKFTNETFYTFSSLKQNNEIVTVIKEMIKQGYEFIECTISFEHDHSDAIGHWEFDNYEQTELALKTVNVDDIQHIDITSMYGNEKIYSQLFPQKGVLCITSLKKKEAENSQHKVM